MHENQVLATFTIASALGVCLLTLSRYLRVSPIVVLLFGGVLAGPSVLGIVDPTSLGDGLGTIISLSVAIILFEGGLTLEMKGYRSASKEIIRILTVGVLVTWLGASVLLRMLFGFEWAFCLLAASLIIVTGPTVIGPLLKQIRVKRKLHDILHWEGVLIDPIGVFVALMCFEFYISTDGADRFVMNDFVFRFVVGVTLGGIFGLILDLVLRREWIDKGHVNIFVLAMAMLNFWVADKVIAESGLLSVTVAGLLLGSRNIPQLRDIVIYKTELKDFLISILFVLLAANLDPRSFLSFGWKLVAVVLGIIVIIRPLNIFASTIGSSLSRPDKLFLSWISPRGIVAASMASIFALRLGNIGIEKAVFLESFTYSVIIGTVLIQGLSAGLVGNLLGVLRPVPNGWVVVGSHAMGRKIASFITKQGLDVVLIDTNAREVRFAQQEGLTALSEDAMQLDPEDFPETFGCGNLLALTSNPDLNRMLCRRWSELLEGPHLLRWEKSGYETAENQHLLVGTSIWTKLPLDRWMHPNSELPPIHLRSPSDGPPPPTDEILLTVRDQKLLATNDAPSSADTEWLVYDGAESKHSLGLPLEPSDVVFTEQQQLPDIYLEMLQMIRRRHPRVDAESLRDEMCKREEDYTSILGHAIAMPHSWTDAVDHAVVMVARPQNEVLCLTTGGTVDIVFMLLSPPGHPKEHLEHLAFIAQLIGTDARRKTLLDAKNADELYHVIALG